MFTVGDTFNANGITEVMFVVGKSGNSVILKDHTGKVSALDPQHYAGIFSKIFDTVQIERYPVTVRFTLVGGWWWRMGATSYIRVDWNAAYAAFLEALNYPD